MRIFGRAAGVMLLALAMLAPAGPSQASNEVINCNLVFYSVSNPPTWIPSGAPSQYLTGAASVAGVTLTSTIVCNGSINGAGNVNGVAGTCAGNHPTTGTFTCGGVAGAHSTPDEAPYQALGTSSDHNWGYFYITSDPAAPLTDVDGTTYSTCTLTTNGHRILTPGVTFYHTLDCLVGTSNVRIATGISHPNTIPFVGPSGDIFRNADPNEVNPPPCQNLHETGNPAPFVPGVGHPNCLRAVASIRQIALSSPGAPN